MRFPIGSKRLEDRVKRTTLLLSPVGFSAFDGNIKGDEAEVSRGRENLINEIEYGRPPRRAQCGQAGICEFYF